MAHGQHKPSQRFLTVNEQAVSDNLWHLYQTFPDEYYPPTVILDGKALPLTEAVQQVYQELGFVRGSNPTREEILAEVQKVEKLVHPVSKAPWATAPTPDREAWLQRVIAAKDRLLQRPDPETPALYEQAMQWHQENVRRYLASRREYLDKYHDSLAGWSSNFHDPERVRSYRYFNTNHLPNNEQHDLYHKLKHMLEGSPLCVESRYVKEYGGTTCHALLICPIDPHATEEVFFEAGLLGGNDIMKLLDEGTTLKAAMEAAALARASRLQSRVEPIGGRDIPLPPPPPPPLDGAGGTGKRPAVATSETGAGLFSAETLERVQFWKDWDPRGAATRGLAQMRASLPEAPWKGWEMPSWGGIFGSADQAASTGAGATRQANTRTAPGSQPRPSGGTAGASTTTKASPAPSTTVSASSASHRSTYSPTTTAAREAEGGKAGLIAAGVGAAALGGWVLWEMSKRDDQTKSDPTIPSPHA